VWQDNLELGSVADSVLNHPALVSEIQIALQAWWEEAQVDHVSEIERLQQTFEQQLQQQTETLKQQYEQEYQQHIAALTEQIEQLNRQLHQTPSIDWGRFRLSMLNDSAYQRIAVAVISDSTGQGNWTVTTLQTAVAMDNPRLDVIEQFWNAMMLLVPKNLEPTAAETAIWNDMAQAANVGFGFSQTGLLTLADQNGNPPTEV
jgi:hypothetical protein